MLAYEIIFVRELLRTVFKAIGYPNINKIEPDLVAFGIDPLSANKLMRGQTPGRDEQLKQLSGLSCLRLLNERRRALLAFLRSSDQHATAEYVEALIERYLPAAEAGRPNLAHQIFRRWHNSRRTGAGYLQTGIYQIFRRFKPRNPKGPEQEGGAIPDPADILIVELLYLDAELMEGIIITSEGNIYWGTAHLNDDATLSMILQRPSRHLDDEVKHRFVSVHAKHPEERVWDIYSGLYIKAGDKTKRPLAGEAIFRLLEVKGNDEIYARVKAVFAQPYAYMSVSEDVQIMSYIAAFDGDGPPQALLRDVPLIDRLSKPDDADMVLLKEPVRTTDASALARLRGRKASDFAAFRRSDGGAAPPTD